MKVPIEVPSSADSGAGEESWARVLLQWHGQHAEGGVEPQRKVRAAVVAQPEMFPPMKLPPVAVEFRAEFRGKSFRQEQFTFAKRSEGNCAGWVGAFMQHGKGPVFSWLESRPERF
jgi:hypothetical protein